MKKPTNRQEFSIAFVWSPTIARSRFVQIPKLLLLYQGDLGITPSELNVLLDILYFKWTSAHPFASYKTLSDMNGLSEQAVRTNITRLKEKGFLIKVPRGANKSKAYDITPLIDVLESYPQIPSKTNPQGVQIHTSTYTKMDSPECPNTDTELYAVDETPGSKRTGPSGKLQHIGTVITNHRPP